MELAATKVPSLQPLKAPSPRLKGIGLSKNSLSFDFHSEERKVGVTFDPPLSFDGQAEAHPPTRGQNEVNLSASVLIVNQSGPNTRSQGKR